MINREYTINYNSTNDDGTISSWFATSSFSTLEDRSDVLVSDYKDFYKDDPNFSITSIVKLPTGNIDWMLLDRMRAVREICELGNRVRADAKIRNRQPLSTAHVLFSDKQIHQYMQYIDCGKQDFISMLSDELNIDYVNFIENADSFVDVVLKPNFKVLGPKGSGKLAQKLKELFSSMSVEETSNLHKKLLNKEIVPLCGINLVLEDVEIEYKSKQGFASASSKSSGVIIIDTNLTTDLVERGFIAELRSEVQNIRKNAKLALTDRVFLEVFCSTEKSFLIYKFSQKLKSDLLATGIKFFPVKEVNTSEAHKIEIDGEIIFVKMFKEA